MSVNKTTWFGVCLKIKDYEFSEEVDSEEKLSQFNGGMINPEDGIYYLIPALQDTTKYGIYDIEYDEEKAVEIDAELLTKWSTNFINDYFPTIQEYQTHYPDAKLVIEFVSVFN